MNNLNNCNRNTKNLQIKFTTFWPIHHFHVDYNAPCIPPPKFCITIASSFSRALKSHQERWKRKITSRYSGSKISGSQQPFLTETAIWFVEQSKKSLGTLLFLSANVRRKVIHLKFFLFFLLKFAWLRLLKSRNFATMATWRNDQG